MMGEHVIKLPDVGEGIAEAELVEWHVKPGDLVREDTVLAAVMTDKATVEIPSPVEGEVLWLGAEVGDQVAVGAPLIRLRIPGDEAVGEAEARPAQAAAMDDGQDEAPVADGMAEQGETLPPPPRDSATSQPRSRDVQSPPLPDRKGAVPTPDPSQRGGVRGGGKPDPAERALAMPRSAGEKPLASPAVRLRAREAGIDLRQVAGTGPAGRITHDDLDAFIARGPQGAPAAGLQPSTAVEDVRIVGLRRRIAERMSLAASRIPHITYVEEVDVTALEELRAALNKDKRADRPKLTLLPFLMRTMVKAIAAQPNVNALFDDEAGVVHLHSGVHIGIATQTGAGLMVPVVRHVEARDLWDCAGEVARVAEAARSGAASREELSGSTITITSLGAMGGIATTPIINHPEVAIVGVNKIVVRPVWDGAQFIPRKMMNLSSSFDHRIVDGWDAAAFVQRIKALLETPAMIFVEG